MRKKKYRLLRTEFVYTSECRKINCCIRKSESEVYTKNRQLSWDSTQNMERHNSPSKRILIIVIMEHFKHNISNPIYVLLSINNMSQHANNLINHCSMKSLYITYTSHHYNYRYNITGKKSLVFSD